MAEIIPISDNDHWAQYAEFPDLQRVDEAPRPSFWERLCDRVTDLMREDWLEKWQLRVAFLTFSVFLTLWVTRYWR